MPKKKPKIERVIKETFELDKQGEPRFKDGFDSLSILVTSDGAEIKRGKEEK